MSPQPANHTRASLEAAATKVDETMVHVQRGIVSGREAIDALWSTVEWALKELDEVGAVELLVEYVMEIGRSIAEHSTIRDRSLIPYLEDRIAFSAVRPRLDAELDEMLLFLELRLDGDDTSAEVELRDLCANGFNTHRHLLLTQHSIERVLMLAYRGQRIDALVAALHPASPARLAHHKHERTTFMLAFDLLAHLACDPAADGVGAEARRGLVDLVGFLDLAGEAAVRLPLHLLTTDELDRLSEQYEARIDLLCTDPIVLPASPEYHRDNELVRTAVWQGIDASRLR